MKKRRVQLLDVDCLQQYGFIPSKEEYRYVHPLQVPQFYAVITYCKGLIGAEVFDSQLHDTYMLFHIQSANGSFVSSIREEVEEKIQDILTCCKQKHTQRECILAYAQKTYQTIPEYPWKSSPQHCTLKTNDSQKWYGIIMHIPYRSLGLPQEGMTDILNVKSDPKHICEKIDHVLYFPAYHMNKTYWVTLLLDAGLPFEDIADMMDESYELVEMKS